MKETHEELGENESATVAELPKKKFSREPPSIPFVWELRPGVPKKDWKPDNSCFYIPVPQLQPSRPPPPPPTKLIASNPFTWEEKPGTPCRGIQQKQLPPPPVKLVASIPFEWEEIPGKPFPNSQQMPPKPSPLSQATMIIASSASTLYSQVSSKKYLDDDDYENDSYTRAWISQMDLESFSPDTDEDSSDSALSLLGNRLHPTLAFPSINALALQRNVVVEIPGSPSTESDASSTSSYMTGATSLADASSLVGASFLECLFPLLPPNNSGFLNKLGRPEKASLPLVPVGNRDAILASNVKVAAVKRPHTLGELILMSRKMSCRRKAIRMKSRNLSMAFMKKNAFGGCLFGINANKVERLQGKIKTQLRLKFM